MTRTTAAFACLRPLAVGGALLLGACGGSAGEESAEGARAAASVPPGTVPRGAADYAAALRAPGPPVTPTLLAEGRTAWLGKCAACHGATADGDGPVVRSGYPRPAPLDPRGLDPAEIVAVVTHGRGAMPSLAVQVPPRERWAIARWLESRRTP